MSAQRPPPTREPGPAAPATSLQYAPLAARAWPWHVARAFAVVSLVGTAVPGTAFLLGYRWEFPPLWMLACVALEALFVPGLLVAPLTDARLPSARRAAVLLNLTALAAAALMWMLLAFTGP